ncbi:MAG: DUF1499 domain-containing protein [Oleiphilaceae bacterium]|nr:DUF1499 domain-containing protein [Oleiphilaceae bacterium]
MQQPMRLVLFPLMALALAGCGAMTEHSVGVDEGQLTDCPQWPRCVSSQEDNPDKQIAPFTLRMAPESAWEETRRVVSDMTRTEIVDLRETYLRAEVISPWRFYTDDLELLLYPGEGVMHVRSTGRIGYYDFNVNRDRVEALRTALRERGVIE